MGSRSLEERVRFLELDMGRVLQQLRPTQPATEAGTAEAEPSPRPDGDARNACPGCGGPADNGHDRCRVARDELAKGPDPSKYVTRQVYDCATKSLDGALTAEQNAHREAAERHLSEVRSHDQTRRGLHALREAVDKKDATIADLRAQLDARTCGCGDIMPPCPRCRPIDDPALAKLSDAEVIDTLKRREADLREKLKQSESRRDKLASELSITRDNDANLRDKLKTTEDRLRVTEEQNDALSRDYAAERQRATDAIRDRDQVAEELERVCARDPEFHAAVTMLENMARQFGFTPGELKQIAFKAALNIEMHEFRHPVGIAMARAEKGAGK